MTFEEPVLLVGNGPMDSAVLALVRSLYGPVIAADGGADAALSFGLPLTATIGDMDSASATDTPESYGQHIRISTQDTTDFEKCLSEINAPLIIGTGFLGGRLDHELAALNTLVKSRQNIVLIGEVDLVFRLPESIDMRLPVGTRISFFPMGAVCGVISKGLKWELSGLALSPNAGISTSNQIAASRLEIINPRQPLLCILPREHLPEALKSFNF